jgi:hypothetical protein
VRRRTTAIVLVLGALASACAGSGDDSAGGWASAANQACETFVAQHDGDDSVAVSTGDVADLLRSLGQLEGSTDPDIAPLVQELRLVADSLDGDGDLGLAGVQAVLRLGDAGADGCEAVFAAPIEGSEVAAARTALADCGVEGTDDYRGGLLRLRLSLPGDGEPAGPEGYSTALLGLVALEPTLDDDGVWTLTLSSAPDPSTLGARACTTLDLIDPTGAGTYAVLP